MTEPLVKPPKAWLRQHRKPRLKPGEPLKTGVTYYGHVDGPNCLCPYCPTELERLEQWHKEWEKEWLS